MKGRKTDLLTRQCGIARALGIIGDWWSLLIIRDALGGRQRFGEFQKSLGLAKNILSSRLKKLVEHGILMTVPEREGAPYNAYVLTTKGEQLGVVLVALWQWGERNCFPEDDLPWIMVDEHRGEPLARLTLRTRTGRPVGPGGFTTIARSAAG